MTDEKPEQKPVESLLERIKKLAAIEGEYEYEGLTELYINLESQILYGESPEELTQELAEKIGNMKHLDRFITHVKRLSEEFGEL